MMHGPINIRLRKSILLTFADEFHGVLIQEKLHYMVWKMHRVVHERVIRD